MVAKNNATLSVKYHSLSLETFLLFYAAGAAGFKDSVATILPYIAFKFSTNPLERLLAPMDQCSPEIRGGSDNASGIRWVCEIRSN